MILFWIFCAAIIVGAAIYLQASIEVYNEMKKAKEEQKSDISITDHDWRNFKNQPWSKNHKS
jgi:hypothetical protein